MPPYTWSLVTAAPPAPGLNLNASTGVIAGTPTATGAFTFTVQVKDSASATASLQFSLTVNASLTITTSAGLNGVAGTFFSTTLAATGGTGSYSADYTVAVGVVDTNGATASATFTISVGLPTAPKVSVNGVPATSTPAQRINVGLTLDSGYKLSTQRSSMNVS